jgi:hypothetical protein
VIEIGDVVPDLAIDVYNSSDALASGGTVTAQITLPDGTTAPGAEITVNNPGLGKYVALYTAKVAGLHQIKWNTTAPDGGGAQNDSFYVEQTASSIVSLSELKDHLRIKRSNDDEVLRLISQMASDAAESSAGTGRRWRRITITGERHTGGGGAIQLYHPPAQSIVSVSADGTTLGTVDYDLNDTGTWLYAVSGAFPYAGRRGTLLVSYVAGPANGLIPAMVRNGVLEMARHLYGMHRGGSKLPRQEEPDYSEALGYLIPNRVASAWQAHSGSGL